MQGYKVSIIISNYNYSEFLEVCLESVFAQTYPSVEVVIVDDGSTDGSRDLLKKYEGRAKCILKENGGETSGRNAGFPQASGDIIAFLDADDFLMPHAVEEVVRKWQPLYSKLQFPLLVVNRWGENTGLLMPRCRLDEGRVDRLLLRSGRYITTPTSGNFYPRWFLEKIMPVPVAEWPQSVDSYAATFAGFYGEIGAIQQPLGFYRVHESNATRSVADKSVSLQQIERLLERGTRLKTLIEKIALDLQLTTSPGIVTSHWLYLKLELAQLKLRDDVPLGRLLIKSREMIMSALVAPELTILRRVQLIAWTLAAVLLPKAAGLPIIRSGFDLAPSRWVPRALRRL